jgi:hypothetical protein
MHKRIVNTKLHDSIPEAAVRAVRRTARESHHSLMLGPKRDQSPHWWVIAALNIGTHKLASL